MKKIYTLVCCTLFFGNILFAQDAMPYSMPLNFNPAFTGSEGCARATAGYHSQYPKILNYILSYDQYVKFLRGGVGLNYFNEKFADGTIVKNQVDGIYSAHIPVFKNKMVIKPAIEGSYVQKKIDWSKLTFGSIPFIPHKEVWTYFDLSSGILMYSKTFHGGFAVHHITEPNEEFFGQNPLPRQYTAHIGANIGNIDSVKSFVVSPSVLLISQQDYRVVRVSLAAKYDKYLLGVGYVSDERLILSAGFQYRFFRAAYGYDFQISRLGIVTAGSHEIALSFFFNQKNKPSDFLNFSTVAF